MRQIEDQSVKGEIMSFHIYRDEFDGEPSRTASVIVGTSKLIARDVDVRRACTLWCTGTAVVIITDISDRGWDRKFISVEAEDRFNFYCRTLEIKEWNWQSLH